MKCKDCKYWAVRESSRYKNIGKCKKIKMFWDSTDWDEDSERIFKDDSLAFVQDGSDYYAELLSKEEFGCVMWESK